MNVGFDKNVNRRFDIFYNLGSGFQNTIFEGSLMMRPVFITALVLIAAGIIKIYDLVVAQTDGGPGIASEVPAKYVMDYMFGAQNLGQGFAASTMMLVSVIVILIPWAYLEFGGKKHA